MSDSSLRTPFAASLIEQDHVFHSPHYSEHRMQLELQLNQAERRERIVGRVVVAALVLSVTGMFVSGSQILGSADPTDKSATLLSVAVGGLHLAATVIFWVGLASYFSRFRPQVKRMQDQLLAESIRELRRDVGELRNLVSSLQPRQEAK